MGVTELNKDDQPVRRVDEVLTVLMTPYLDEVQGKRLRRLRRAEADLRLCIEEHGERAMKGDDARLLALERQFFGPEGATARVASAPVLLLVLPSYLEEPRWQGDDEVDRRVRMRLALRLARAATRLPELGGLDVAALIAAVEQGWRVANRRLRRERAAQALARLTPDQRAAMESLIASIQARRASPRG